MASYPPGTMESYPPKYPGEAQNNQRLLGNSSAEALPYLPPYGAVSSGPPSPPPPYSMEKVPGYENATFDNAVSLPPTAPETTEPPPARIAMPNLPHLTEEDVREAVIRFAAEDCCYGVRAATDMAITEITMKSAFYYTLESFGEKRETAWRFVPYTGQGIDGPSNGPAPTPWNITVIPPEIFKNSQSKTEVPHTAFVKPCHVCVGNGRVRCERCRGRGRVNSSSSNLPDRCFSCSGRGQQECGICRGRGNLKGFVELTVTWTNHVSEYIPETTEMPRELIRKAVSRIILQENMPKVIPVTDAGDLITTVSQTLITKHGISFSDERILRQRQILRIIPIAHCNYRWKHQTGDFCVYGFEHKVFFNNYPQPFCCTCNIL